MFPSAVSAFARTASTSFVYGNVYDARPRAVRPACHSAADGSIFELRTGWPTGGAGTLIPASLVRRITLGAVAQWSRGPGGIDLHFACSVQELGFGLRHLPVRFLDACLYCEDFLIPREVRES